MIKFRRNPGSVSGPMVNEVCRLLSQPDRYPEPTSQVELCETHISWVFLTDHYVYKLKKPVRFDFLDFSTPELREAACRQELALNRRLSPDVYLDVVPIVRDARGKLHLGGAGRPVDWTVKMARLPADAALDERIRTGRLDARDIDQLAERLAAFYLRLPPVTVRTADYCRQFEEHIRANEAELIESVHRLDTDLVAQAHGAQLRFLSVFRDRLIDRARDGRIVEGHGDLRPEHIYLTPEPKIIDCIEFSAELRRLDVADELAFLAMECDRLGASWVGDRVAACYAEVSDERPDPMLVNFFKSYRACVRAKVNVLRARQLARKNAEESRAVAGTYLELAAGYAARLGPPLLLVVRGTSGTGKSTLAEALAHDWGACLFQTDAVRNEIFRGVPGSAEYGQGKYAPENRLRVYDEMFRRASQALERGRTIILDGTFLTRELRDRALQIAAAASAAALLVHCECPEQVAWERVRDRAAAGTSSSEIRPESIARQRAEEESDRPAWPACHVDTTEGVVEAREKIDECIRPLLDARRNEVQA